MVYGYARVSTKLQATDGNSLETQERQLRDAVLYIRMHLQEQNLLAQSSIS